MESLTIVLGGVFVLAEYFLGKTTLVKSGSTLELILNGFVTVYKSIFK